MTSVAIMGFGVVGSALFDYLEKDENLHFKLYDPAKELDDDLKDCDTAFICVPAPTLQDRKIDLHSVEQCLKKLLDYGTFFGKPIFIKTTMLPGSTDFLAGRYLMNLFHMPEFLTERTSFKDMAEQDIVCGGGGDHWNKAAPMVIKLFPKKNIHFMTNVEAELAKYAHNVFCASKVNFFNTIADLAHILGAEYQTVLAAASLTGFIEPTHTQVPGHDGKIGFGGKCLPKDLKSFIGFLDEKRIPSGSLRETESENQDRRPG